MRRKCGWCGRKIKIMTPPQEDGTQYCCEIHRKADVNHWSKEEVIRRKNAAVQKSPTQN